MDRIVDSAFNEQFAKNNFVGYVPDNELSPDLQKKLKRINRLPNGLYETKFKIDRYKFDRTMKNELQNDDDILQKLFDDVATETGTSISIHMKSKSNSKLRNPLINVVGAVDNIELAKERILSIFENIKMRVVLKMDVSYKDHSHIIGRGGFSIQKVMDDSSSHIHFPDSNRISDVKKSNVVLICGSPCGVEQARCKIRSLLPLVVHFKIPYEFLKPSSADTFYTKSLRSIQQTYNVHISLRQSDNIDENYAAIFDGSRAGKYIAVSVRGANNDLDNLKKSLSALIFRLTENPYLNVQYALTIEITEIYHQLVGGVNHNNIKNITQMTNCQITFPDVEPTHRSLDFDNLNEIPVNKSTVIIKGSSFEAVHLAWKELIGYLPLVLTFDVAHDQHLDTSLLNNLKKQYKVAIFLKHKEKYNTVVIRGIEKNSKALFEVRKQLLKLEDAEIPICCDEHNLNSKLTNYVGLDENGNHALLRNDNSTNILNLINSNNGSMLNSNLLSGISNNATNILNAKMIHNNIDSNNNLQSNLEKNFNLNSTNFNTQSNMASNLTTEQQIQNGLFNPNLFRAVLQEQFLLQQQQINPRVKSNQLNNSGTNLINNTPTNNTLNLLENLNLSEEFSKFLLKQQQNLLENPLRNTHSVSDIPSLQTNQQIFNNGNQNEALHQSIRKEHLTSSCSSPALHAMVMQHHSPSSLLNNTNNYSLNNSNLNSTGNNTSSTSSGNATSSTANNSFNMNGLNSSPPPNTSFNSSLINNSQSPIMPPQNVNWSDQRRQQLAYDECRYLALKNTYEKQDINDGVRIPSSVWSGFGFSKSMTTDTTRNRMNEWNPTGAHFNTNAVVSKLTNGGCLEETTLNKMTNGTESNEFVWDNMLNQNNQQLNNNKQRPLIKQESEICSSTHPYSSNYLNNLINNNHQSSNFAPNNQQNQLLSSSNLGKNLFMSTNGPETTTMSNERTMMGDQSSDNLFIDVNNIDLYKVLIDYGLVKYVDKLKEFKVDFPQFLSLTEDDLDEMGYNFIGRKKLYSAIIDLRKILQSNSINNNYNKVNEIKKQDEIKKLTTDLGIKQQQIIKTFSNSSLNDCTTASSFTPTKDVNANLTKQLVLIDNATNSILNNDNQTNENAKNEHDDNYTIDEIVTKFKSANLEDYEIRDDDEQQLDSKIDNCDFKNENDFELGMNSDLLNQEEETKSSTANESSIEELNAKSLNSSLDKSEKNKMINQEEATDDDDLIGKQSVEETAQA